MHRGRERRESGHGVRRFSGLASTRCTRGVCAAAICESPRLRGPAMAFHGRAVNEERTGGKNLKTTISAISGFLSVSQCRGVPVVNVHFRSAGITSLGMGQWWRRWPLAKEGLFQAIRRYQNKFLLQRCPDELHALQVPHRYRECGQSYPHHTCTHAYVYNRNRVPCEGAGAQSEAPLTGTHQTKHPNDDPKQTNKQALTRTGEAGGDGHDIVAVHVRR